MSFAQDWLGLRQMLENREHHYIVELRGLQRQRLTNVLTHALPLAGSAVSDLIVYADTARDAFGGEIQKRSVQSTTQVAHARAFADVRIRGLKTHASDEVVQRGVGHYLSS